MDPKAQVRRKNTWWTIPGGQSPVSAGLLWAGLFHHLVSLWQFSHPETGWVCKAGHCWGLGPCWVTLLLEARWSWSSDLHSESSSRRRRGLARWPLGWALPPSSFSSWRGSNTPGEDGKRRTDSDGTLRWGTLHSEIFSPPGKRVQLI